MSAEQNNQQPTEEQMPGLEQALQGVDQQAMMQQIQQLMGKQPRRYAKAMQKMGLDNEEGVLNVRIRKTDGISFNITKPEVYKFPGTNTFVLFGDAQVEEADAAAQQAAAAAVTQPAQEAKKEEEPEDETEEDQGDIADKEIEIVMSQAGCSRNKAIRALKNNKGDIVNTIMELTM